MSIITLNKREYIMCGIVGVAGFIGGKEEKAFQQMLQLDVLRGKDSTGIIAVTNTGDVMSAKEAWLPQDLLSSRAATDIFRKSTRLLIGHNRAATVGAVNKAGAHPFEFDNVIGVHNGTTSKAAFLNGSDYNVDSEALYDHYNEKGVDDMWKNMTGAASLAFYDKEKKRFGLLRNSQRPMQVAFTKDKRTFLFASEWWMICVAAERAGLEVDVADIVETTVDHMYLFNLDFGKIGEFTKRAVAPYVAPKPSSNVTPMRGEFVNRFAKSLYQLHTGQKVEFRVLRTEKVGGSLLAHIESTSTTEPLLGRMYLNPVLDSEDSSKYSDPTKVWVGKLSSVTTYGATQGYTVQRSSVESVSLDFDDDIPFDEDCGIYFEGDEQTIYTREKFDKGEGVSNTCSWCSNPVSYELLDFKGAGRSYGKQQVLCDDCASSFIEDIVGYTELQDVFQVEA